MSVRNTPPNNSSGVTTIGRVRLRWRGTPKTKNIGQGGNWFALIQGTSVPACRQAALQNDTAMSPHQSSPVGVCLTLNEVADRLQVCRRTLEREIAAGNFPRPLKIGRSVRIPESDLQAYLTGLRAKVPQPLSP